MLMSGTIPNDSLLPGLTLGFADWWNKLWWAGDVDASTFSNDSDNVFFFIFWVSVAFFVLLMFLMVVWAIQFRRRPGVAPEPSASHNTALELTWSIVPTILMAIMFFWGLIAYIPMKVAPANSEVINVTAKKWGWTLLYDNGATPLETEMIADMSAPIFALPVNRPTKFVMSSQDVIHSMYMPAFRIKRDVFPNFYTTQWVQPTKTTHAWNEVEQQFLPIDASKSRGFYLACTEYCGDNHSQMWGRIMVLTEPDYQRWKAAQANTDDIDLIELGKKLYNNKGCLACHSVDGAKGTGPTWKGIWGKTHNFKSGEPALVDENYIRESILEPGKRVLENFANQMPSYQGQFTDRELFAVTLYIKSLSDNPADKSAAEEASVAEMEAKKAKTETEPGTPANP